MHAFRITMILLVALGFVLAVASCNTIAITGDKKYKSDMSNALQNVKNEIEQNGSVSDAKLKKLESLLASYQEEYSKKGSHIISTEAVEMIYKAKEDPANEFKLLQQANQSIYQALDTLKTEVKD